MKKHFAFLIALVFAMSAFIMLSASAEETETTTPDWIITEMAANQQGNDDNTNGYTSDVGKDCFEFVEIYNNSGRELNLYDYAMTYSNTGRDAEAFEGDVLRYTPFKPGDYLDGTTLTPNTGSFGDLSNKPVNPDTCMVAPGEVVVLWTVYYEAYLAMFNEGKGMSIDDFRAHWNIPENVKVIAVDGNGNASNGGNPKNFNIINSGIGTYGIALQNEAMSSTANVTDGAFVGSYLECSDMIFWATLDYKNVLMFGDLINQTISFTWDFAGYAAIDQAVTDITEKDYAYDARRGYVVSAADQPTPGALNVIQKMTLGVELAEGESYAFSDDCMYWPMLGRKMLGFKINGELYEGEVTFTAPAAGKYSFDFYFEEDLTATTEEITAEEVTEVPTTVEQTTEVPTEAEVETEPESAKSEGGCKSVMLAAILPCLALAAVCMRKKRD